MGQTHSFVDTEQVTFTPDAGVPMLDWPSDLFSDDVELSDLVTVDFVLQCDPAFLPQQRQSQEFCTQLAA